jgi:hypothetical protein
MYNLLLIKHTISNAKVLVSFAIYNRIDSYKIVVKISK